MAGCRPLTEQEITDILQVACPKTRLLILVGLTFGTRISEALNITFGDISDEWITIKALKGGRVQTYPVPSSVTTAVEEVKALYTQKGLRVKKSTPLFVGRGDQPMSRQNASQQIKRLCAQVGIKGRVNTHSFRKNFVTAIYKKTGKDLAKTRLYSRHVSLGSLQHYIDSGTSMALVEELNWR